ncbi:arsenate reductase (glutaredoxin) [Altererythrobacter sp. KTW20L]|uniref:arsenate reductase (glutaredoxin) n=1 Tax=Altererythrobacter sp. KTW20L TaxID=2942210 RepID=UPI00201BD68B|nr:arsenate reductase (glutaredoxin) [Altererythrobacter sp. KTW20L]MCL6250877.1 arsenate reductase (glutaredoxin) [Altererythrobacter sp. KTW20L]
MKATIWHNPRCSKSRNALQLLRDNGYEVDVIEYLRDPPTRATLARLYASAGMEPAQGLRITGTDAVARGLPNASADEVLDAMAADPSLIERPLVETGKGVRLGRPTEQLQEIM